MVAYQVAGRPAGMPWREQRLHCLVTKPDYRAVSQLIIRRRWEKTDVAFPYSYRGSHSAPDFVKAQQVVLMAVSDQDSLDLDVAQLLQELLWFCRGVDNDSFVGLGTHHNIAVVVIRSHVDFVDFYLAVIMHRH